MTVDVNKLRERYVLMMNEKKKGEELNDRKRK